MGWQLAIFLAGASVCFFFDARSAARMMAAMLRIAPWWFEEIRGVRAIRWHGTRSMHFEAQAKPAPAGIVKIRRVSEFETGFYAVDA